MNLKWRPGRTERQEHPTPRPVAVGIPDPFFASDLRFAHALIPRWLRVLVRTGTGFVILLLVLAGSGLALEVGAPATAALARDHLVAWLVAGLEDDTREASFSKSMPSSPENSAPTRDPEPALPGKAAELVIPVLGVTAADLGANFGDPRSGGRRHQGLDIMARRGTPVVAAVDGRIWRRSKNRLGGLTLYLLHEDAGFGLYYAHLDGYAPGLEVGDQVEAGDLLGFVGTTGNAPDSAPHLHLELHRLGFETLPWTRQPVDPRPWLITGRLPPARSTPT